MDAVDLSYYSSVQEYELVRELAISLRHEKFILAYLDNPLEFLKHFATYTWDEEADEAAEEFIQWYVERFRAELEEQREIDWSGPAFGEAEDEIEDRIKDLANDEREVVTAIDLDTGETVFVRYGDEDSVTLHDDQKKLVEDRNIALLHNHPNNSAASLADLDAAGWLKAEYLIVVNPDGTQHRYARVGDVMIPLDPIHNPDYVAAADPLETLAADVAYWAQSLSEIGNPPERVMEQGERDPRIHEQSFHPGAAPIKRNYVRYSEPERYKNVNERLGLHQLQGFYAEEEARVKIAAIVSGIFGYDDASHNLRHFLGGSGDPIDDLSVDKMIDELPLFRADIIQNVRDSLVYKIASAELEPIDVSKDSTTYAFPTDWRFVGSEGKAEADVYGFRETSLNPGYDTFNMLTANPPEGVEQAVYDWHLALGKFYYSVRVNVKVNNATQDAELVMQVEVQDHYAWYENEEVGEVNRQMAKLELVGEGRNFAISGESGVIERSFNLKHLETGREKPLFDWPEDG